MKILVLGADGMLGHQLVSSFRVRHDVAGTVRKPAYYYGGVSSFLPDTLFDSVDVKDFQAIENTVTKFKPDAIVNAIGIVKQRREAKNVIESIEVNALLPHRLANMCLRSGVKLIHLSTDCVFTGTVGGYADDAVHDARDIYGRSKSMGETEGPGIITLRTSIIGLELARKASLVEWFLAQEGQIHGFTRAIYSGFSTLEMARIIERLVTSPIEFSGTYNVSSEPLDKFSLLYGLRDRLRKEIEIIPDDSFKCDRSLNSDRFRSEFSYQPPAWDAMLDELATQIRVRCEIGHVAGRA
ncbi:MAG TPA: SDR family oxidoreductase [Chiayiivirga sp.]|jgi:dTDP-4-dehydrorhamnose reductase|nr:SDR family oxidoreductase [Chiayiivirga sp.]